MKTIDTVVVGGGQAGLAMSYCLMQQGVDHVVLERGDVGQRWRAERWDSLTLLTPNWATQLPGFHYDGPEPDGFVSRAEYVAYLEAYARSFDAPVHPGTTVTRVSAAAGPDKLAIETSRGPLEARNVVAATGPFHVPVIPSASHTMPAGVLQIHTSQYRRPDQLPDGGVLVVGSGNSGLQIVVELLAAGKRVFASLGRVRSMPRRYRGRDNVRWQVDIGALDRLTEQATPEIRSTPPPLLSGVGGGHDLNLREMSERGAVLLGRLLGGRDGNLQFSDDLDAILRASAQEYRAFRQRVDQFIAEHGLDDPLDATPCADADLIPSVSDNVTELNLERAGIRSIIWATGFRVAYDWIDVPVFDDSGQPVHERGVSPHHGLYFLGLRWLSKYKSFFIYGVGEDARRIAAHIASSTVAALIVIGFAAGPLIAQNGVATPARPAWVVDGVPDAVWLAVEAASTEKDKDRAKELLKAAEVQARGAIVGHEGHAGRRFALAVVLGLRTEREGGKTKIGIATDLKKELEATLAIDPEHGRARHMMGRLNAAVLRMNRVTRWIATSLLGGAELKKATWIAAERDLSFAEAHVPEVSDHHLQLAYLYRDTKRPGLAMTEVEHVLAMPLQSATERAVHAEALNLKTKLR